MCVCVCVCTRAVHEDLIEAGTKVVCAQPGRAVHVVRGERDLGAVNKAKSLEREASHLLASVHADDRLTVTVTPGWKQQRFWKVPRLKVTPFWFQSLQPETSELTRQRGRRRRCWWGKVKLWRSTDPDARWICWWGITDQHLDPRKVDLASKLRSKLRLGPVFGSHSQPFPGLKGRKEGQTCWWGSTPWLPQRSWSSAPGRLEGSSARTSSFYPGKDRRAGQLVSARLNHTLSALTASVSSRLVIVFPLVLSSSSGSSL